MAEEDWKDTVHTPYMGYEFGGYGVSHPSIGYRYQQGNCILDLNVGYKYMKINCSHLNMGKVGINAYRVLHKTDKGQIYAGVGAQLVGIKGKSFYGMQEKDHAFHPSVSIGHDFNTDEIKKVFFELTYKPYEFGKYENTSIHSIGCRIGFGF